MTASEVRQTDGLSFAQSQLKIKCCMLVDFHSNDGTCSTGNGIGSRQRFLSPGKKTVAVKTAKILKRQDKKPLLGGYHQSSLMTMSLVGMV